MSFFDLHSDAKIPRDGVKKHTVTAIPSEAGSTSGLIRFRWTSSQNQWFVPHLSYVLYEFAVSKTGGLVQDTDVLNFVKFPGAAASDGGPTTLQLQSTNIATVTNPAITQAFYTRLFGAKDTRDSIMDPFVSGLRSHDNATFTCVYQPPAGIFQSDVSIPNGSYVLGINLSNNYINSMVANRGAADLGALIPGLNITLTKATFMAVHVEPSGTPAIPRTVTIPLVDISTNNQSVTSNGTHALSFSIPASTKRVLVATQGLNPTAATSGGATALTGAKMLTMHAQFKGSSVPQVPYDSSNESLIRKYLDFYNEQLSSGRSVFNTIVEYDAEEIIMLPFASDPNNLDTNLVLRTQINGGTLNSLVHVGTIHDSALVCSMNGDSSMMESCTYAVLS